MKRFRNGLLITALLAATACCTVCGTRDAHAVISRLGVEPVPQSLASNPDSGEPDAGSTRTSVKQPSRPNPDGDRDRNRDKFGVALDGDFLVWIGRSWIARYLGTGL